MWTLTNSTRKRPEEGDEEAAVGLQVMPSVIYKQSQVAVKYLRSLMELRSLIIQKTTKFSRD